MMTDFNVTGLIISVVLIGVVFMAAYYFKKRVAQRGAEGAVQSNKGCSMAFYVFLALVFICLGVAYIVYRANG